MNPGSNDRSQTVSDFYGSVSKVRSTNALPENPREAVILSEAYFRGVESLP